MTLKITEKQIEKAILNYLARIPGCKAWKANTTGIFDPTKKVFRRANSPHSAKGCPDILGVYQGKMFALEVKSAKGRLAPHQADFIGELRACGAYAHIVRSIEDAINILKDLTESKEVS